MPNNSGEDKIPNFSQRWGKMEENLVLIHTLFAKAALWWWLNLEPGTSYLEPIHSISARMDNLIEET